ncbi:pyridoxine/pyridoxamine 5'-phosphate oxidase isoform X2 [Andrena cerasifolii]|uniref:pyridoxine/pyridoxamine 5'-phosphate oxidase isoform X2 n=1 Tax=Andrena cerasifolii TaxID=2819439 RepID=UPI004037C22D
MVRRGLQHSADIRAERYVSRHGYQRWYSIGETCAAQGLQHKWFQILHELREQEGSRTITFQAENPSAAVTFYWEPLRRCVRIEGKVKKTSAEDSNRYFESRPYSNQIGSMSSKQSTVIASRQTLMVKERELIAQFPEGQTKRPDCWGGYIIIPEFVEFWQGQSDRLHDRIRFRRPKPNEKVDNILVHQGNNGWVYEILSP